jgi:mRNA interferase RelE/StbE
MFEIYIDSQPKKFLKVCEEQLRSRLMEKLHSLETDPIPHDAKRVIGRREKTFRVRVGKYRILYCVFYETSQIFVSTIDKRPRAYD